MCSLEFKARYIAQSISLVHSDEHIKRKLTNEALHEFAMENNVMLVVCAYCSTPLKLSSDNRGLSHGICTICVHEHFPECIEDMPDIDRIHSEEVNKRIYIESIVNRNS